MVINVVRQGSGWMAECRLDSGLCVARASAGTWYEAWWRLAGVLQMLRVSYSLKVSA